MGPGVAETGSAVPVEGGVGELVDVGTTASSVAMGLGVPTGGLGVVTATAAGVGVASCEASRIPAMTVASATTPARRPPSNSDHGRAAAWGALFNPSPRRADWPAKAR